MRRWPGLLAAVLLTSGIVGCTTDPIVCTTDVVPGVVVEIRDGFDGTPLAATARGAVQDGSFLDSLRPYRGLGNGTLVSRAAADERPGTYLVTVAHPGYITWQGFARVRANQCHVETVTMAAYLAATP